MIIRRNKMHKIYREARELIAKRSNWGKGAYECDGKFCLMGAIITKSDAMTLREPLHHCIQKHFPSRPSHIEDFNDHPRTTHKDVLKVLDCAIADTAPQPRKEPA